MALLMKTSNLVNRSAGAISSLCHTIRTISSSKIAVGGFNLSTRHYCQTGRSSELGFLYTSTEEASAVITVLDGQAEGSFAESVNALARIATGKQHTEAAFATLQNAAGLAQLSRSVVDAFSSGNIPKAAENLANMRHCLFAAHEVEEFMRKQVEVLEERLHEMVLPCLVDALSNRKADAVQDLRGILMCIGRFKSLEVQHTKVHVKTLKKLWEDFDLKQRASRVEMEKRSGESISSLSFSSWLPNFYDETLLYLEQEWKWCSTAFPEEYKSLVPKVLVETMNELNSSFVSRANMAIGDIVRSDAKGILDVLSGDMQNSTKLQNKHLQSLIQLHNMTGSFARNVQHLFSESDPAVLLNTFKAIYSPYEIFKARYGQMEYAVLSAEMASINIRRAVSHGVGAQGTELSEIAHRMEDSIPQMIALLEAAVERCISLTGGSEADEMLVAIDDIMRQYISNLQEIVKYLRMVCRLDSSDAMNRDAGLENFFLQRLVDVSEEEEWLVQGALQMTNLQEIMKHLRMVCRQDSSDAMNRDAGLENFFLQRSVDVFKEEEWSIVQGALQMINVADYLASRTYVFEASLRGTLARIEANISLSGFGSNLHMSRGTTKMPLGGRATLDIAAIRLGDLPDKSKKLFTLLEQSKDPMFHALSLTSERLADFSETVNELVYDVLLSKVRHHFNGVCCLPIWSSVEEQGGPLPSLGYPQAYMTSVGEYLLALTQLLVDGTSGNEACDAEAQFFATECIVKVAAGATTLFMEQLSGIQYITERGAQQLATDIEYLRRILSAYSMHIPPFLSTFHVCVSTPRDQVRGLVESDGGSELDLPTAHLVSKIRRISLD